MDKAEVIRQMEQAEAAGDYETAVELGNAWKAYEGKQGMGHPPPSPEALGIEAVSKELGYDNVDWQKEVTGLPRADLGLSTTPEAVTQKLQEYYPGGEVKTVGNWTMVRPKGEEKWFPYDKPDFTMQDISDMSGEALPIAGGVAATALGPAGLLGASIAGGGGAFLGDLANMGIEKFRGYQIPESPIAEAATTGLLDTGAGLGMGSLGKVGNMLSGRGVTPPHSAIRRDLDAIYRMQNLPRPMTTQVTQPGQIANRLGKQAESVSVDAKNMRIEQAQRAADEMRTMGGKSSPYRTGLQLKSEALAAQYRALGPTMRHYKGLPTEKIGATSKRALDNWVQKKDSAINQAYGRVDQLAAQEKPLFNLQAAKDKFSELGVYGTGVPEEKGIGLINVKGDEFTKQIWPLVNAAETPGGKLRRVGEILGQLDNTQTNWRVIKELRSSVGKVIKNAPWESNIDIGSAKRMYGALTETLENPTHVMVNGVYQRGIPGQFTEAVRNAGRLSRQKFDVLSKSRIRHIFQTDDIRALGESMGKPGGLTPEFRDVLSGLPKEKEVVSLYAQKQILQNPQGARKAMEEWIERDAVSAQFLFGKNSKELNDAINTVDSFYGSSLAQINANTKPLSTVRTLLLSPDTSRADVQGMIKNFGGKNSRGHELMRAAIMEDIVGKSLKLSDDQGWTVSVKALREAAEQYRKNGAWTEILTKSDRTNLDGMEAYARRVLGAKGDVGVSLEIASAISDLKHPSTFIRGIREIGVNKLMAEVLMNKKVTKALSGTGKSAIGNKPFAGAGLILGELSQSVFADPAVQDYMITND